MDAANVDLKAFTEDFYRRALLRPPAAGARHARVAQARDQGLARGHDAADPRPQRLRRGGATRCAVVRRGSSARTCRCTSRRSTPTSRCWTCRPTPPATLTRAREHAKAAGLTHVYTGNVHDVRGQTTGAPAAASGVIGRDWYEHHRLAARRTTGRCRPAASGSPGRLRRPAGPLGRRRRESRASCRRDVFAGPESKVRRPAVAGTFYPAGPSRSAARSSGSWPRRLHHRSTARCER